MTDSVRETNASKQKQTDAERQTRKDTARVLQVFLPFVHPHLLEMSGNVLCNMGSYVQHGKGKLHVTMSHQQAKKSTTAMRTGPPSSLQKKGCIRFTCRAPQGLCYSLDEWDFVCCHRLTKLREETESGKRALHFFST